MSLARLLLWRLRLAWAGNRGRGRRRRVFVVLWVTGVGWTAFFAAWVWTRTLLLHPDGRALAPILVLAVLHATLFLSLLRDTAAALGHLFLSPDVSLLLSAPVRPRSAVMVKGVEALADAAAFPLAVALPVLLGYGLAVRAPAIYFLATPLALFSLLALTVGTGFLISLSFAPWVPAGRVRQWIRSLLALFYLGVWLAIVMGTASGGTRWMERLDPTRLASWSPLLQLPSQWAGGLLLALAAGRSPAPDLARLAALSLSLLILLGLASGFYPVAWQRAQDMSRRAPRARRRDRETQGSRLLPSTQAFDRRTTGVGGGLALAPSFARRDAKLLVRDANLLWDILLLLVMTSFLPLVVAPALVHRPQWLVVPALLFFATELGYDLGSRAFPLERRALRWVLAAPIAAGALCVARVASWWVMGMIAVFLAWTSLTIAVRLPLSHAVPLGIAAAFLLSGSLPVGLAAGIYLGRTDWKHPREMLDLGGRLLLLALLLVLCGGLVLAFPRVLEGEWSLNPSRPALAVLAVGEIAVVVLALLASRARLRRFEWLS